MSFSSWLRSCKSARANRRAVKSRPVRTRPHLQELEHRCLLSTAAGVFGGVLWGWTDTAGWKQLTSFTPSQIAVGNNGSVTGEFSGSGVWRYQTTTGWQQLTGANTSQLAMGADGSVGGEFPGDGVWRYKDTTGWQQLTGANSSQLAMGEGGSIVADISGSGVWRYEDTTGWQQLTRFDTSRLAMGADGSIVGEFPGSGVWRYEDAKGWQQLTRFDVSQLAMGDDGSIVGEFPGNGVWRYEDTKGWQHLSPYDASQIGLSSAPSVGSVAGQFGGSGVWVYTDTGGWSQLTRANATLFGFNGEFNHDLPLDPQVQGSGFNLTSGAGQNSGFTPSAMQLAATRTYGGTQFNFYNDTAMGGAWTSDEITVVMVGVADVNSLTGYNNALMVDPKYGNVYNFALTSEARLQSLLGPDGTWSGINADQGTDRLIAFLPWDTTDTTQNGNEISDVGHEMSHNFDDSGEKAYFVQQQYPNGGFGNIALVSLLHWQWIGQSGWVPTSTFSMNEEIADRTAWLNMFNFPQNQLQLSGDGNWYYLASLPASNFASEYLGEGDYSKYNPYEDWATTFQVYEQIALGLAPSNWRTTDAGLLNKLKIMDDFFAAMGHTASGNLFSSAELTAYNNNAYTLQTGYHGNPP